MDEFHIILVGCGATGSNVATFISQLAAYQPKIKEITLIDGDIVESKNCVNQKFIRSNIGKNKAEVLSRRFSKLNINIGYYDKYITTSDLVNIMSNIDEVPILVGAVDNISARKCMHEAFLSDEVKSLYYIDTGNGDKEHVGQTILGFKNSGKIEIPPVAFQYPEILQPEIGKGEISYHCTTMIRQYPQNLATNLLSATVTFLMINNIVSYGKKNVSAAKFDADNVCIKSQKAESLYIVEEIQIESENVKSKILKKGTDFSEISNYFSNLILYLKGDKRLIVRKEINGNESAITVTSALSKNIKKIFLKKIF